MTSLSLGTQTPFQRFEKIYHDLSSLVQNSSPELHPDSQLILKISWITLVDYFDMFCRQQFMALAKLLPEQKFKFIANGPEETSILITAKKLSLDSGEAINNTFNSLIGKTPLSKDECLQCSTLLTQRSELLYTSEGELPMVEAKPIFVRPTWLEMSDILFGLAVDITRVTTMALKSKLDPASQNFTLITAAADKLLEARFDHLE